MIWLAGIAALALMLAVLELDPSQLAAISLSTANVVPNETWQNFAYVFFAGFLLLITVSFVLRRIVIWQKSTRVTHSVSHAYKYIPATARYVQTHSTPYNPDKIYTSSSANSSMSGLKFSDSAADQIVATDGTVNFYTPLSAIRQLGVTRILFNFLALTLFCGAILCHSVAQRIAAIEQSPSQVVYVEATVTPLGLSDKRLELEVDTLADQDAKVEQGYRQLVTLSDIRPYTQQNGELAEYKAFAAADNLRTSSSHHQSNPFLSLVAPADTDIVQPMETTDVNKPHSSVLAAASSDVSFTIPETMTVMLYSYQAKDTALNVLAVNQQIPMRLALSPIEVKQQQNSNEFDEYRWLSSRHATAKAKILEIKFDEQRTADSTSFRQWIDIQRLHLRQHFLQLQYQRLLSSSIDNNQAKASEIKESASEYSTTNNLAIKDDAVAVTLSLLTGDRSLISKDMSALYRFAGISHLLAISGTHVLFLAMLCAASITFLITRLRPSVYRVVPRWQCSFLIAVVVAFAYAIFAGFDVPAMRTAFMLLIVGVLRYLLAVTSVFKVLLLLAVAIAVVDIFVLWQAGFWLSFIAVSVLIVYSKRWEDDDKQISSRQQPDTSKGSIFATDKWMSAKSAVVNLVKLQLWMSVALLPISLWLFGKVSLWGFVINLFAIGLFGWVIVPINLLAGVIYAIAGSESGLVIIADKLWYLLFFILNSFHNLLSYLQAVFQQSGWLYSTLTLPIMMLILSAALPWMLAKGVFSRKLSLLPLSILIIMVFQYAKPSKSPVQISVIDPKLSTESLTFSLSLIQNDSAAWLLLSAYEKGHHKESSALTTQEADQLTQVIYDHLRLQNVDSVTGVVVQTATPELAIVVAKLRDIIPISYYWQAGLNADRELINKSLADSSISVESCQPDKQWQTAYTTGKNEDSAFMQITAVTGWQEIDDPLVWDCAIQLKTNQAIQFVSNHEVIAKNTDHFDKKAENAQPSTDSLSDSKIVGIHNNHFKNGDFNNVLILSSAQQQLMELWKLMCAPENNVQRPYLLTTSRAYIDNNIIDILQPKSWHIVDARIQPAQLQQKETQLYWRQQQKQWQQQYESE